MGKTEGKSTVIGVLAHVDAGKTTLSESILYHSGAIRKEGRVDSGDSVMDSAALEKERGITIFSGEARFSLDGRQFTLMDTPGHVDFSAETERALSVLDYCILVISGTDGVQAHTGTLWRLLSLYGVPVFIFVTKMDYARRTEEEIFAELRLSFGGECVSFSSGNTMRDEEIACSEEALLEHFLETGTIENADIRRLIRARQLFPVFFGSGLKGTGVPAFLSALSRFTEPPVFDTAFSALVHKITHDEDRRALFHVRVTGGKIAVKDTVFWKDSGGADPAPNANRSGEPDGAGTFTAGRDMPVKNGKIQEIRVYSGGRFARTDALFAGETGVLSGLSGVKVGDRLFGTEADAKGRQEGTSGQTAAIRENASRTSVNSDAENGRTTVTAPVMRYSVMLPEGTDPVKVLPYFEELAAEDPALNVHWNWFTGKIEVGLMGEVQGEILLSLLKERFGLAVSLSGGHVLYKETVRTASEGVGHYEPLRHYAEVHLLIEPLPRGAGVELAADCDPDSLDRNWQNLILYNLYEKRHRGVLTGSPLTDVRITLKSGRAHLKHTEGGDFREAALRAVRNGLMKAENALLEPFVRFRLELPVNFMSRGMDDIRARSGRALPPLMAGDRVIIAGRGPAVTFNDYPKTVASYSSGEGRFFMEADGYDRCHNPEEVIAAAQYDPLEDLENPAASIFCAHGAGFYVEWQDVEKYMHLPSIFEKQGRSGSSVSQGGIAGNGGSGEEGSRAENVNSGGASESGSSGRNAGYSTFASDRELEALMEKEFGPIRRKQYGNGASVTVNGKPLESAPRKEILIIDGYNVIFAWEDLSALAETDIAAAREKLVRVVSNYAAFTGSDAVLVFDGYRVPGNPGEEQVRDGLRVVYTKERESGDLYIEKFIDRLEKGTRAKVVTSDGMIQLAALRKGVLRISSREFLELVNAAGAEINAFLEKRQREAKPRIGEITGLPEVAETDGGE